MSVKITELAKKLGMTGKELQAKIAEMNFEVKKTAKTIDDDLAVLIEEELTKKEPEPEEMDKAEVYDELIHQELEKELIKKQRKQLTHKDKESALKTAEKPEDAGQKEILQVKKLIEIPDIITVKEFSEKAGISAAKVIGELMKNGILANINQKIDYDTAVIVADDLGIKLKKKIKEASVTDFLEGNLEKLLKDDQENLIKRPPVVSVMGHVDHGKTKLLDMIRETNVVATEAGGITQRIGAYQVEKKGQKITFLDTPGHQAFTEMRARGAKATDIAILVVAADEGVKPQTIEALNHAREAKIPIIVALNKTDKEGANIDRVKTQLAELGLQPEDWSGDTPMIPLSALTGEGIDNLLDTILIISEMLNLKANANRAAIGTVIEANLDLNLGPTATILVNTGTLKIMDNVIVGEVYGRIKVMKDYLGKRINKLGPSGVALISGLSRTPQAGDILQVVKDEKMARQKAAEIEQIRKTQGLEYGKAGINEIISRINQGKLKTLKIILKTDTKGSLEAVTQAISKIKSEEVAVQIIHSGVGNILESDIMMASASKALLIGFSNFAGLNVKKLAEREKVQILIFDIIYKLTEMMTKMLSGMLTPEIVTVELGKLMVKQIFYTTKQEMVVGGKVIEGKIENKARVKVMRKGADGLIQTGEGLIINLKVVNQEIKEVNKGDECGIKFKGNVELEVDDVLEAYKMEERVKTLEVGQI